jgi:hypothetical protein
VPSESQSRELPEAELARPFKVFEAAAPAAPATAAPVLAAVLNAFKPAETFEVKAVTLRGDELAAALTMDGE